MQLLRKPFPAGAVALLDSGTSMNILARRVATVPSSATKAMTARADALRGQGRDVVILSQGEPDFETPDHVRDAAIAAIRDGRTRYTPVAGVMPLREAIALKLRRDNGLDFVPDAITVGCGAKQVIFNALLATLDPGDEVIIPTPCWVSYPEMVRLAGGEPIVVDCPMEAGFKIDAAALERAVTPRSKWLILNSPQNPSGAVYSRAELAALAEVMRRHPHLWLLSDEIYEKLVFAPAAFASMAEVAPDLGARILIVNGVSKSSAMTGWRVGYGAGPAPLIAAMNRIQGQTSSHTSSISQYAAIAAIAGCQLHVETFRRRFQARRDRALTLLREAPGLECLAPDGAFYLFPRCAGLLGRRSPQDGRIDGDIDFAAWLLEAGVAVVPGSSFLAPGHVRLSFASADAEVELACRRIVAACGDLH